MQVHLVTVHGPAPYGPATSAVELAGVDVLEDNPFAGRFHRFDEHPLKFTAAMVGPQLRWRAFGETFHPFLLVVGKVLQNVLRQGKLCNLKGSTVVFDAGDAPVWLGPIQQ